MLKYNRGFTYIEVLMAVTILAFVLIPLLSQFYIGFKGNIIGETVTQATDLATDLMEEIKGRRFDENTYPDTATAAAQFGVDSGETSGNRTTYDDVDDYNNYSETPPKTINGTALTDFSSFTRQVTLAYVTLSGATWINSGSITNYKKITVTITHPKIASKVLETIVAYY